jgi:serine phosphatase RsbU (regulator of sigma subunit)
MKERRREHGRVRLPYLAAALLLFVPLFLPLGMAGRVDPGEASACLGVLSLYAALRPFSSRMPLSRRLMLVLVLTGVFLLLIRLVAARPAMPPLDAAASDRAVPPFSMLQAPDEAGGPRNTPIEIRGTIDSFAREGGKAIRRFGLFRGSGTVGNTMGALGAVTSTTAEVLIRTVYSGSNVVMEDSVAWPTGTEARAPGVLAVLALAGAAATAVLLLIQVRYLILVERRKGTLGRFRVMVSAVFLQVLYVSLGLDSGVRQALSSLGVETRVLLSVSPFYLILILYSIINGFRVQWIHYMNRWRKYLALVGAGVMIVLSQSVLSTFYSGRLTACSIALGSLAGCVATALFFYSIVTAVSIMLHLPSARLVDRKLEQLRILDGLGQSLYSTFEEDQIMATAVSLGRRIAGADRCWAVRPEIDSFEPWGDGGGAAGDMAHPPAWHREALQQLQDGDGTLLINRYASSPLAGLAGTGSPPIGSLLASLLRIRKRTIGILYTSTDRQYGFMTESGGLFATFARQVAAAVENSRLITYQIEQERYHEELAIARAIQEGLLPGELPVVDSFDIAGASVPSRQVGGDYYDVFSLPGGLCAFAIADVAGKGTAAALLMAALESALHAIAPSLGTDAGGIVDRLNRLMSERMPSDKFITFFYGVLDPSTGEVSYCCAGHDPPLLLRADGDTELLVCGGLVLGVLDTAGYETGTVHMADGDRLILYTDGITETMDRESGELEFGAEGLVRFLTEHSGLRSRDLLDALMSALTAYRGDAPAADDMTLLIIGRASRPLCSRATGADPRDDKDGNPDD